MGCFSFLCKKCGAPINSDSFRGQRVILYLLRDGKVIETMSGEYDSYGRVFDEEGESIKWSSMPWSHIQKVEDFKERKDDTLTVCDLMFKPDIGNGICAIHERCSAIKDNPVERSSDDPNQGWGYFKKPKVPFKVEK